MEIGLFNDQLMFERELYILLNKYSVKMGIEEYVSQQEDNSLTIVKDFYIEDTEGGRIYRNDLVEWRLHK